MKKSRIIILVIAALLAMPAAYYTCVRPSVEAFAQGGLYLVLCAAAFALFCAIFAINVFKGRIVALPVLGTGVLIFLWAAILLGIGYLAVKFFSGIIGLAAYIGAPVVAGIAYVIVFGRLKRKAGNSVASVSVRRSAVSTGQTKFDLKVLYGAIAASFVAGLIALLAGIDSTFFFVPCAVTVVCVLLWRLLSLRVFLLVAFVVTEYWALSSALPAAAAVTSASFLIEMALTVLYLSILAPIADLYCRETIIA